MLKALNLYKSFGPRRVLRGLNLTVAAGEIVALIGMNGAGKSTLLRILSTLTKPEAGTITLNGISARVDPMGIRSQIGVVLHAPMLYGNLTGRENLKFFCRAFGVVNAEIQIERVLEEMNLTNRSGDIVRTYSRGMQQRLSIARAILHHPQYLLMDEPFTGLDEDSILRLNSFLKRSAQAGISILFATHDLEHACGLATRVDILHEGTIKGSHSNSGNTPENLRERYRQVISPTLVDLAESKSE